MLDEVLQTGCLNKKVLVVIPNAIAGLSLHLPSHQCFYYINWIFHNIFLACKKLFHFDRKYQFFIHFPLFLWHILFLGLLLHECLGEGSSRLHQCKSSSDLFEGSMDVAAVTFMSPLCEGSGRCTLPAFSQVAAATLHVTIPGHTER